MVNLKQKLKSESAKLCLCALFVLTEAVLYVLIHTTGGRVNAVLSFSSILTACIFSLITLVYSRKRGNCIRLGMLFTVLADFFLVLLNPAREFAGVLVFWLVQLCYFIYILKESRSKRLRSAHIGVRVLILLLSVIIPLLVLGDGADALAVCSVVYYGQLICNLLFAFIDGRMKLFATGLLLFAMCDLSIGLGQMGVDYLGVGQGNLLYEIYYSDINIAWVFYLPSQVLIPLSLTLKPKDGKR